MLKSIVVLCVLLNFCLLTNSQCLVGSQPYDILTCVNINPTLLVNLVTKGDLKTFCSSASTYMSCMKDYFVDCIGGKVATGALDELMELNRKCCISTDTSKCVIKSKQNTIK